MTAHALATVAAVAVAVRLTGRSVPARFPTKCTLCAAFVAKGSGAVRAIGRKPDGGTAWQVQCDRCERGERLPVDSPALARGVVLTTQQDAVVNAMRAGESIFVRARAGTGKTFTLVQGLIAMSQVSRRRTAVLAFNREMADELREKCPADVAFCRTLDAIAHRALTLEFGTAGKAEDTAGNWILDGSRLKRIARGIARLAGLKKFAGIGESAQFMRVYRDESREGFERFVAEFNIETPEFPGKEGIPGDSLDLERWYRMACETLAMVRNPEMDSHGRRLFSFEDGHEMIANGAISAPSWLTVIIDEAQDVSVLNIDMLRRVVEREGNVIAVGDDRQAIYGFRGAAPDSVERLIATFGLRELPLTLTRRCAKAIVALAREIVPDFEAAPDAPDGSVEFPSEGEWHPMNDVSRGEWIISRTNAPLVKIAMSYIEARKPFRFLGRDALASIRNWCVELGGDLRRFSALTETEVLARASGATEAEQADAELRADDREVERLADRESTLRALALGAKTGRTVLDRIAEISANGGGDPSQMVTLSSVHQAKGKEAHTVHMCGTTFYMPGGRRIEEENLWYVAVTRAKTRLVIAEFPPRKRG